MQIGAEAALALRDHAFGVAALTVKPERKTGIHFAAEFRARLGATARAARIDWNGGASNSKFRPAEPVKRFGVVGGIGTENGGRVSCGRLTRRGWKKRRIVTGAASAHMAENQVRGVIADQRGFDPGTVALAASAAFFEEIAADVGGVPAGAVQRSGWAQACASALNLMV
jgi:hypothetical protein